MCRKQGLKTAWKDWFEQRVGKNCQSEQESQGMRSESRGRGQQGRKKAGRRQGQGFWRAGVKDQLAFVWCWECPGSWLRLPVSGTPSCAPASLSAAAAKQDINCTRTKVKRVPCLGGGRALGPEGCGAPVSLSHQRDLSNPFTD